MRLAILIVSLVLMFVLGIQALAVMAGGSIGDDQDLAGAGALGVFAALLWLIGAAFVLAKPKASMWLYAVAGLFCILGATSGFSDLYIWAFFSALFALASWRGIKEKASNDEDDRARYRADVAQAATDVLATQAASQTPKPQGT
jgi:hypothetical protein